MYPFIIGRLLANEIGAEYQGDIYDRWLSVMVNSEVTLRLFDRDLFGNDLQTGTTYEFIVNHDFYSSATLHTEKPMLIEARYWYGQIIATSWSIQDETPPVEAIGNPWRSGDEMKTTRQKRSHLIVQTSIGCFVHSERQIKKKTGLLPQPGQWLNWSPNGRYDLLGVRFVPSSTQRGVVYGT